MKTVVSVVLCWVVAATAALGQAISKDPYIGAIVVDAANGNVLFEDGADRPGYPASMLKLMTLFVALDRVEKGMHRLDETVGVTREAMEMGGTQVWLDTRESFPLEEMLYAMIVASANDAAMAVAIHMAGSRDGFVKLMNEKARELGLSPVTRFQSPNGLPPPQGVRPDMTTPRDFAKLSVALLKQHPEALKYTSTTDRPFRGDPRPFLLQTSNRILRRMSNCDGLKTGYFKNAGFSISATAHRDGRRVIAVIMGSVDRKVRDEKAIELLNRYLPEASLPVTVAPAPAPVPAAPAAPAVVDAYTDSEGAGEAEEGADEAASTGGGWKRAAGWLAVLAAVAVGAMVVRRRRLLTR